MTIRYLLATLTLLILALPVLWWMGYRADHRKIEMENRGIK